MKTLDQERATFAWGKVKETPSDVVKEFRGLAKNMPSLVLSNGLMQSLAFLEGKRAKSAAHRHLLLVLLNWLASPQAGVLPSGCVDFPQAMDHLSRLDAVGYQHATQETLAFLRWLRYLADTVA